MGFLLSLGLVVTTLAVGVRSASSFQQPPGPGPFENFRDNPVYDVGESVVFEWTTDLEEVDLILWQAFPGTTGQMQFASGLSTGSRTWDVTVPSTFDTDVPDGEAIVAYVSLYDPGSTDAETTCHYFNITVNSASTTIQSSSTSTPTSSSTSTPPSNNDAQPTDSPNDDGSKSELSTGAVAGISVGAAVSVISVATLLGYMAWRHRQARTRSGQITTGRPAPPAQDYKANYWQHVAQQGQPPSYGPTPVGYVPGPGGMRPPYGGQQLPPQSRPSQMYEMSHHYDRPELPANQTPHQHYSSP